MYAFTPGKIFVGLSGKNIYFFFLTKWRKMKKIGDVKNNSLLNLSTDY
jgi:hypothetical protein